MPAQAASAALYLPASWSPRLTPAMDFARSEPRRRAFITILMVSDPTVYVHVLTNVRVFVYSLVRKHEVGVPVVVLVTPEVPQEDQRSLVDLGATVLVTPTKLRRAGHVSSGDQRRQDQLTKIVLWNLTEFDELAYYDSDLYFHKSPARIFEDCKAERKRRANPNETTTLRGVPPSIGAGTAGPVHLGMCAVRDYSWWNAALHGGPPELRRRPFFNTGCFVMWPSRREAERLWRGAATATSHGFYSEPASAHAAQAISASFPDQQYLNVYFRDRVGDLPDEYNLASFRMRHSTTISSTAIAVHERYFVLDEAEQVKLSARVKCHPCRTHWLADEAATRNYLARVRPAETRNVSLVQHPLGVRRLS